MRKTIFIGNIYPPDLDSFYEKKGKVGLSSVIFNQTIVDEMIRQNCLDSIFGVAEVGHFPMFSKTAFVKGRRINDRYYCVGFNNLIGINVYSKSNNIYRRASHLYRKNDQLNIIVSEISISFLRAAYRLKKRNKGSTITLIVFDLPQFVEGRKQSNIYSFLKKKSEKKLKKYYSSVDNYVYLSERMKELANADNKPSFVFPGIVDLNIYDGFKRNISKTKDIVYCGVVSIQFDIKHLLDSFVKTKDDNLRLIIAGGGDGVDLVKECAKKDNRIIYKGLISRKEALQLQLDAYCLINPRLPNHDYSVYSFPSKTMNYLLTSNPTISYVNSAFPKEIQNLLIVPKDYGTETLAYLLDNLASIPPKHKDQIIKVLSNYSAKKFVDELKDLMK